MSVQIILQVAGAATRQPASAQAGLSQSGLCNLTNSSL